MCGKEGVAAVRSGNINQCQSRIGSATRSHSLRNVCMRLAGGLQLAQIFVSRDVRSGLGLFLTHGGGGNAVAVTTAWGERLSIVRCEVSGRS